MNNTGISNNNVINLKAKQAIKNKTIENLISIINKLIGNNDSQNDILNKII